MLELTIGLHNLSTITGNSTITGYINPNLLEFFPMLFYVRGGSDNPLLEESICNQEHFFKY